MKTISITQGTHTYPVQIGQNLLCVSHLQPLISEKKCAILCDSNTSSLFGKRLWKQLQMQNIPSKLVTIPEGESSKTRQTKETIENHLLEAGFGRDSCLIAIGGGVISDLGGFTAATFCRGIPLIIIPTTLLSMVDACIGGKNGVNTPHGKNLIGTFYPPKLVLIDTELLNPLPEQQLRNGMSELIKHALIADKELFETIENHLERWIHHPNTLENGIHRSCEIKKQIVEQDPEEKNLRKILNFGHTIGHALEKVSFYTLSHGEAVAIGMILESKLSNLYGILPDSQFQRITSLLKKTHPNLSIPSFSEPDFLNALKADKKNHSAIPHFVFLDEIGKPASCNGTFCTPLLDWETKLVSLHASLKFNAKTQS